MLLQKDRKKRLGQKNDVDEILGHKFFKGIDFEALLYRKIKAEFIPKLDDKEFSTVNFDNEITSQRPDETVFTEEQIAKIQNHEENFKDFDLSSRPGVWSVGKLALWGFQRQVATMNKNRLHASIEISKKGHPEMARFCRVESKKITKLPYEF